VADRLCIIDGHAQFFRAYYAIRGGLNSPVTNEPTNMVYGFCQMLLKLLRDGGCSHVALVIDASGDTETFRSELYPEYKAHREPPPEDFDGQVERCLELARLAGIPIFAEGRVEADDVIATLVRRVRREHPEASIRIASKDKDLAQLLDARTVLYDVQAGTELTAEGLFDSKGVRPEHVVDMLTLMGDSVDNVPGVPGIGPKTAAQLVVQYGSVEGVLEHLADLTPKRREAIEACRDQLALARTLVRLKDDCDVAWEYDRSRVDAPSIDATRLLALLDLLGFGRLRQEWSAWLRAGGAVMPASAATPEPTSTAAPAARSPRQPANESAEGTLFAGLAADQDPQPVAQQATCSWSLLTTVEALAAWIQSVRAACADGAVLAFDTETDERPPRTPCMVGFSGSVKAGEAVYVPMRSADPSSHLDVDAAVALLKPLLEDASIRKVAHNAKFDLQVLRAHGIRVAGLVADTMIESFLLEPERSTHGLGDVAQQRLGQAKLSMEALTGSGPHRRTLDRVDAALTGAYAATDADLTHRLHAQLSPQLDAQGLRMLHDEVELPLVQVLAEMEWNGIRVEREELQRQRARLEALIVELRGRIAAASPVAFNPDSPKQLASVLFNPVDAAVPGLGLPVVKRTKTGASTDAEVLEALADDASVTSPLPGLIVEYRQLTKLVGTYLVALEEAIDPTDGRVHASFHQTGAATGRLSSSDPNLQNIPIRTPIGREIRAAFAAPPGSVLLACDYSQVELRVLAHLSGDPALCAAFAGGQDIHTAVAAEVHGIGLDQVTPEQRNAAKMVNFGIVYGITPHGLARRMGAGTSQARAKEIIQDYKARFAGIEAFLQQCIDDARTRGYATTILGRRRPVPQLQSRNGNERALGQRIAVNTVVQGSAADLIKVAMVAVHRGLPSVCPGARLLLQIHDELVLEVPESAITTVQPWVAERMQQAIPMRVPILVSSHWGTRWLDAK
jgi:DNA polymerase-1